jgi:outer membrane protein TolC
VSTSRLKRAAVVAASVSILAGCTANGEKDIDTALTLSPRYASQSPAPNRPGLSPSTPWWQAFRDPALNGLIEAARVENLDIRQATQRIESARLVARINRSDALPRLDAEAQASLAGARSNGRSVASNQANVGLSGSWLINPLTGPMSGPPKKR